MEGKDKENKLNLSNRKKRLDYSMCMEYLHILKILFLQIFPQSKDVRTACTLALDTLSLHNHAPKSHF